MLLVSYLDVLFKSFDAETAVQECEKAQTEAFLRELKNARGELGDLLKRLQDTEESDELDKDGSAKDTDEDNSSVSFARNLVEVAIRTKVLNIGIMKTNSLTSYMDLNLYSDEILFSLDKNCLDYCDKTIVKTKSKIGFL